MNVKKSYKRDRKAQGGKIRISAELYFVKAHMIFITCWPGNRRHVLAWQRTVTELPCHHLTILRIS